MAEDITYKEKDVDVELDSDIEEEIDVGQITDSSLFATRKDLQMGRRMFHASTGTVIATMYYLFFTHERAIHLLGLGACIIYLLEQVRINYPRSSNKIAVINRYFLRAEEQLKESAAIPYAMALLLTIISFPQIIALIAIYTLAFGDPLSAVIGIRFGKHHIVKHKSVEGSLAFFIVTFFVSLIVLSFFEGSKFASAVIGGGISIKLVGISFILALVSSAFEMIPLKIDDNFTIPLFTAVTLWVLLYSSGLAV